MKPAERDGKHHGRVAALTSGIAGALPKIRVSSHYQTLFISLFSLSVVFSLADLFSTAFALRIGLSEGNYILVAIANYLGLSIVGALAVTKAFFLVGCFWAAVYGIRTRDLTMRKRALLTLSFLVLLLMAVSLNNLYWIASS